MTSYGGEDIVYDAIGNPIIIGYLDGDGVWSEGTLLDWEGRQLVRTRHFENTTDSNDISGWDITSDTTYTYNADGIRTGKNASGTKFEYILNGSQLIGMRWTQGTTEYLTVYIYDDTGSPIGMKYRTSAYAAGVFDTFFFEKNLQGDIIAVYDEIGTLLCSYIYDAWGTWSISYMASGLTTAESAAIGYANPFRYRGYIYESDIGCYYLQSRYYNPNWGRFINADAYVSTGQSLIGNNMFAYCNNNPIAWIDYTGEKPNFPITIVVNDGASGLSGTLGTYSELRKLTAGNPFYQVHHLIEVRFMKVFNENGDVFSSPRQMPCVIVSKEDHVAITSILRKKAPYGTSSGLDKPALRNLYSSTYGNGGKGDWMDYIASYFD